MSTEWLADDAHKVLREKMHVLTDGVDLNEATTRLRIIDTILFEVLRWDVLDVEAETHCRDVGYVDYLFGRSPSYSMVVEAKKDGTNFVLPEREYPADPVPFALLAKECPAAAAALTQAHGYANQFGAKYSGITNGRQWLLSLTFVPNQSVQDRLVYVFESLEAIERKIRGFYECFSSNAINTNLPNLRLLEVRRAPAPSKLSSRIAGYPIQADRNKAVNMLRGVLQLVWDEIHFDTGNEIFLRSCYIIAEPAADMLRVARELLQQRSLTDQQNFEAASVVLATKSTVIEGAAAYEQPVVLLGRIGHGKSTFLKYLRNIEAKDILRSKYIQIDLDFLAKPASPDGVANFILDQIQGQLQGSYGIEVHSDAVVRQALRQELREFRASPRGALLSAPGRENELADAEVAFIETFTADRDKYFSRLMKLIRRGQGKSIAIFFDNLDRSPDAVQEQAFLRAAAIAAEWGAMVFVCLRPSTMKRSQARGVLDTIAPRIIIVSPPQTVPVLRKRFQYAAKFARKSLAPEAYVRAPFTVELNEALLSAAELFDMCDQSIFKKPGLAKQFEAVANGNVRLIVKYVRDMLSSNHFDSGEYLQKLRADSDYLLTEHDTVEALLFGRFVHYEPSEALFLNLFDILRADPAEHFSRLLLLEYCHRQINSNDTYGFVRIESVQNYMASIGYSFDHVAQTLKVAFAKKCIEGRDADEESQEFGDEIRITSLGSYHISHLVRRFVYVDAMTVDTPILDNNTRQQMKDVRKMKDRIERSRAFLRYLDRQAEGIQAVEAKRIWSDVCNALAHNITDVEKAYQARGWD